jgi:protein-disulfide isomerase-like protein with CxxC motif
VQDNDFTIWNRWGVRAWPTLVLVDKRGTLRYRHIGEGAYAETEALIQRLLAERG